MSRTTVLEGTQGRITGGGAARSDRSFYVIAGALMLFLTAVGFRNFFLHGKAFDGGEITAPIYFLVIAHGVAMTGWVILFFVQSLLISRGNRRLHMAIGPAGAVLAGAIVVLGAGTAILSTHYNPPAYRDLGGGRYFLALMLTEVVSFAILAGTGVVYRRRADIHRPMMLLATLQIMSGSLGRWPVLLNLVTISVPIYLYGPMLVFGALLFVLQWKMNKVPNRWFATGYGVIAGAAAISVVVANSSIWNQVAGGFIP